MPQHGPKSDVHGLGKRRRKHKVKEVAEAIGRENPQMPIARKFKIANATVSKMRRR